MRNSLPVATFKAADTRDTVMAVVVIAPLLNTKSPVNRRTPPTLLAEARPALAAPSVRLK
jgi:hypothetical protein